MDQRFPAAQVVKLVDTLASGASARKGVEVQVLSWAPSFISKATPSADRVSNSDSRRGLFQLRASGACVIRLTTVRLETPDHPLLGTIPFLLCFDAVQSLAVLVSRQRLHVGNRVALVNDLSA